MSEYQFPVRPNYKQLKNQAKDLLRAFRCGEAKAADTIGRLHPKPLGPADAKLADAQLVLARSYGLPNWPRLVLACRLTDAIWRDDVRVVRAMVLKHPQLLHEDARGVKGNWGPPMSYAANLGRDRIVGALAELGAMDIQFAFDRACLQGRTHTARMLYKMGAQPTLDAMMGAAETLNGSGMALLFELGAARDTTIESLRGVVGAVLQTYCRAPRGKHECLALLGDCGVDVPNSPAMAVHCGRIDRLELLAHRDPKVIDRTLSHREIYPLELGCHEDESLALHGTPLAGGTLLHMCVDFDEIEIARWLIAHGADVNARARVDADGFGGHTPLFGCVVSQPYRVGRRRDDAFARLLIDAGADLHARASLRKRLRFVDDESLHEYDDVSLLTWGERFHDRAWVNPFVVRLIAERSVQPKSK